MPVIVNPSEEPFFLVSPDRKQVVTCFPGRNAIDFKPQSGRMFNERATAEAYAAHPLTENEKLVWAAAYATSDAAHATRKVLDARWLALRDDNAPVPHDISDDVLYAFVQQMVGR